MTSCNSKATKRVILKALRYPYTLSGTIGLVAITNIPCFCNNMIVVKRKLKTVCYSWESALRWNSKETSNSETLQFKNVPLWYDNSRNSQAELSTTFITKSVNRMCRILITFFFDKIEKLSFCIPQRVIWLSKNFGGQCKFSIRQILCQ